VEGEIRRWRERLRLEREREGHLARENTQRVERLDKPKRWQCNLLYIEHVVIRACFLLSNSLVLHTNVRAYIIMLPKYLFFKNVLLKILEFYRVPP